MKRKTPAAAARRHRTRETEREPGGKRRGGACASCRGSGSLAGLHQAVGNRGVAALDEEGDLRASLRVSQPGDPAEREAERVADAVMRGAGEERVEAPADRGTTGAGARSGEASTRRSAADETDPRSDEAPDSTPTGGMCPRCIRRARAGNPLDCEECEAALQGAPKDAPRSRPARSPVTVHRTPGSAVAREAAGPSHGGMCERCQERFRQGKPLDCEDCERTLQRAVASRSGRRPTGIGGTGAGRGQGQPPSDPGATDGHPDAVSLPRGGGKPIPEGVRSFFEGQFGQDFGDVRVHTGPRADRAATALNARAFTVGGDIAFRSGEYRPGTREGDHLLAHELTHVVQQRGTGGQRPAIRRTVLESQSTCSDAATPDDAPAGPNSGLTEIDDRAQRYAGGTRLLLSLELAADDYVDVFGRPPAHGGGFMNRLTGHVSPSQDEALRDEIRLMAKRFELVEQLLGQPIAYRCDAPVSWGGCDFSACDPTDNAGACDGVGAIKICPNFWDHDPDQQAGILIHEASHVTWASHEHPASANFHRAQCYEQLVAEIQGFNPQSQHCPAP